MSCRVPETSGRCARTSQHAQPGPASCQGLCGGEAPLFPALCSVQLRSACCVHGQRNRSMQPRPEGLASTGRRSRGSQQRLRVPACSLVTAKGWGRGPTRRKGVFPPGGRGCSRGLLLVASTAFSSSLGLKISFCPQESLLASFEHVIWVRPASWGPWVPAVPDGDPWGVWRLTALLSLLLRSPDKRSPRGAPAVAPAPWRVHSSATVLGPSWTPPTLCHPPTLRFSSPSRRACFLGRPR